MATSGGDKRNWIAWAIVVVAVYVIGYLRIVGPTRTWDFLTQVDTPLNNIGDFLAGLFAFPAFVLLAAAVLTQRQELSEARDQFVENQKVTDAQLSAIRVQNEIAYKSARANYQLALHDKRLEVFHGLLAADMSLTVNGHNEQVFMELIRCIDKAQFLFGKDALDWLNEVKTTMLEHNRHEFRVRVIEKRIERERNEAKKEELVSQRLAIFDEQTTLDDWIIENIKPDRIRELFEPLLRLPTEL